MVGAVIIPILQVRKLKDRDINMPEVLELKSAEPGFQPHLTSNPHSYTRLLHLNMIPYSTLGTLRIR